MNNSVVHKKPKLDFCAYRTRTAHSRSETAIREDLRQQLTEMLINANKRLKGCPTELRAPMELP